MSQNNHARENLKATLEADYTKTTPIPSPHDTNVSKFLETLEQSNEETRKQVVTQLNERHGFVLTEYAERMAAYAVRTSQVEFIQKGLLALSIAYYLLYYKEVLIILTLLYHSTRMIGLDPERVFKSAALLNTELEQVIDSSLKSKKKDWSIEAMGYQESDDEDGFRYKRTW